MDTCSEQGYRPWDLSYDQKKDLPRIKVPVEASPEDIGVVYHVFDKRPEAFSLIMTWDR